MDGRRAEERRKRQRFSKEGSKKQRGEKTLEKPYPRGKEKNGGKTKKTSRTQKCRENKQSQAVTRAIQ